MPSAPAMSDASSRVAQELDCSELDRVPVDVCDVGVRNTWSMFAAVEQMTAGLLDEFDRSVDGGGRPLRKMNAEVLEAAVAADTGALVIGHSEVKRERVVPAWRTHEDNVAITKLFLHAERLGVESDRPRLVSHQEMDVANPDRSQGSSSATEPCN